MTYKKAEQVITLDRSPTSTGLNEKPTVAASLFCIERSRQGHSLSHFIHHNICGRVRSVVSLNSNAVSPHSPVYNACGMPYAPLLRGALTTPFPSNPRLQLQRCFLPTPHHTRDTVPLPLPLSRRQGQRPRDMLVLGDAIKNPTTPAKQFASLSKRAPQQALYHCCRVENCCGALLALRVCQIVTVCSHTTLSAVEDGRACFSLYPIETSQKMSRNILLKKTLILLVHRPCLPPPSPPHLVVSETPPLRRLHNRQGSTERALDQERGVKVFQQRALIYDRLL